MNQQYKPHTTLPCTECGRQIYLKMANLNNGLCNKCANKDDNDSNLYPPSKNTKGDVKIRQKTIVPMYNKHGERTGLTSEEFQKLRKGSPAIKREDEIIEPTKKVKIAIGNCQNCGRELRVKKEAAKAFMHLTCKCGWHGYVGGAPSDMLKCKNCGERITIETYKANGGLCSLCAKGGTIAKLRRIPQWQCPHCKTIFLKSREFQENQRFFLSRGGLATVTCGHCLRPIDGNALYGGAFDYREGSPSPSVTQAEQPLVTCFICQRAVTKTEKGLAFSCETCGFSGTAHAACLGIPAFGVMLGFVQNVCPRCKETFSKSVDGVEETLIDEIITHLDAIDRIDRLPLPAAAKLSTPEWTRASTRLADIGSQLDKKGGFELMQKAFNRVHNKSGRHGSYLDRAWDGIGQWQA